MARINVALAEDTHRKVRVAMAEDRSLRLERIVNEALALWLDQREQAEARALRRALGKDQESTS